MTASTLEETTKELCVRTIDLPNNQPYEVKAVGWEIFARRGVTFYSLSKLGCLTRLFRCPTYTEWFPTPSGISVAQRDKTGKNLITHRERFGVSTHFQSVPTQPWQPGDGYIWVSHDGKRDFSLFPVKGKEVQITHPHNTWMVRPVYREYHRPENTLCLHIERTSQVYQISPVGDYTHCGSTSGAEWDILPCGLCLHSKGEYWITTPDGNETNKVAVSGRFCGVYRDSFLVQDGSKVHLVSSVPVRK